MRVLGVIPARGGSKGIPDKNLRLLKGKPILQYTIESARSARCLSRLILTTDSEAIAEEGRRLGVEVPFLRPAELGRDDTPMAPVVRHAVRFLESNGDHFEAVCLLQPTSPLRRAEYIDGCYELLTSNQADTVLTVLPVPHRYNPFWLYLERDDGWLEPALGKCEIGTRQELPPCYLREGSVYLFRRQVLRDRDSLFGERTLGYPVDPGRSVNLDSLEDWERAEQLLEQAGQ